MSAWMLYATLVALLMGAAAWILERAAHSHRAPLRWIWMAALVASCAIPLASRLQPTPAAASFVAEAWEPAVTPIPMAVTTTPAPQPSFLTSVVARSRYFLTSPPTLPPRLDPWAASVWAILTLVVLGALGGSFVSLRRSRRRWANQHIDGRDVLVSEQIGPAVVGVVKPEIVVPRWALSLPPLDRELVLRHEEEHRRAGDLRLLFASLVLLAAAPWNLALWWQVRRLRMAVELDCDRRVLRNAGGLRRYASLLVEMGRRGTVPRLGAVALAHPASFLERRIRTMTTPSRPRLARTAAFAMAASLFALVAYQMKAPELPVDEPVYAQMAVDETASLGVDATESATDLLSGQVAGLLVPNLPILQVTSRITGRVRIAGTETPLGDARVSVVGFSTFVTSRQDNGVYMILNMPAGSYRVRAERASFATVTKDITLAEGSRVEVDFELTPEASGLDEIVIPGQTRPERVLPGSTYALRRDAVAAAVAGAARPAGKAAATSQEVGRLEEIVVTGTAGAARRRELEAQRASGQTPARPEPRPSQEVGVRQVAGTGQLRDTPQFTPHRVKPRLENTEEVQRALVRSYPPALRDAEISGTVVVWMFIDQNGVVDNALVQKPSGYADLDEAGLAVARTMRFTPAYNGDQIVPVWVSIPITFRVGSATRAQSSSTASNVAREIPTTQVAGRVTGRVVDRTTGVPLNNVQVYVRGISLGTLTRGGTFSIAGVPPGSYEVRAERIGLTGVSRQITVPEGGVVEANFELSSQAIGLAEILSDGSVGAPAVRRESLEPISEDARARAAQVPENVPRFTPHSVRPELVNGPEVQAVMVREYPAELREAGIRGTAVVWLFIDASGAVENVKVQTSSGYPALDEAAVTTARSMRFTPAFNRDQKVAVWVAIPITFRPGS